MAILTRPPELAVLRQCGRALAAALAETAAAIQPGVTTAELNEVAEAALRRRGAKPSFLGFQGYPTALCTSINDQVVHGIPSSTVRLRDGDIIGLDLGAIMDGIYTDHALTVPVGQVSPAATTLIGRTAAALAAAIAAVAPGKTVGDIGAAVRSAIEPYGYGIIRQLTGHGVGRAVHEDPQIPNWGQAGSGPGLVPGMVLAIEPMVTLGGWQVQTLDDGWTVVTADGSLAAHFEHTVLVTNGGAEIITVMS